METGRIRVGNTMLNFLAMAVLSIAAADDKTVDPSAGPLLAAHNRERSKRELEPLKLSDKLCKAAAVHARDMADHRTLEHKGSDGSNVADRVKRQGYVFVKVGENIANGQTTVNEVMTTWMNSPGHRENILADYTEMGAAHVEDADGVIYWCVDFGLPMPRLKPEEAAEAVIKQWNLDRVAAKRPKLKADPALGRAAMKLGEKLAAKDSLKLEGDPFKVIDEQGVRLRELRLMLSANAPTPKDAAKSLLGDDAEELNAFEEIGVGYAIAESGTPYWCAIFAKPAPPKRVIRP
jgi:uncharacterized protein YkwD